jgi:pimeloyl-ACP methyl ester carboxylesterase
VLRENAGVKPAISENPQSVSKSTLLSKRRRRQILVMLAMACGSLGLLSCRSVQRRMIYFPPAFDPEAVDRLTKAARLERWITPAGAAIGWQRRSATQPASGQVLILHGNACCAFHCVHYADAIQQAAPFDVYVVEYPGYAGRPGQPSERALDEAADQAFQQLDSNLPAYLVGESLGTGVATYLAGAHARHVAGVVLLAPFNNLADVGQVHLPIVPVKLLLRDRFASEDHLRNYHGPIAVLVAGEDRVVPAKFGRRLYDGYTGPKRLWEFPRDSHDSLMERPLEVWKEIIEFLRANL